MRKDGDANRKAPPIEEADIEDFLENKPVDFRATLEKQEAAAGADFVITATSADYDSEANYFST